MVPVDSAPWVGRALLADLEVRIQVDTLLLYWCLDMLLWVDVGLLLVDVVVSRQEGRTTNSMDTVPHREGNVVRWFDEHRTSWQLDLLRLLSFLETDRRAPRWLDREVVDTRRVDRVVRLVDTMDQKLVDSAIGNVLPIAAVALGSSLVVTPCVVPIEG